MDFFTRICRRFDQKELDDIILNITTFLNSQMPREAKIWKSEGDEFLIVIPNMNKNKLYNIVLDAKKNFKRQKFAINSYKDYSNISMTFSAGVAGFPVDGNDIHTIIKKSMVGLFLAKAFRRNRVVLAPESDTPGMKRILYNERLRIDVVLGCFGETGSVNFPVLASQARLWEPQAVDIDNDGNVYIVDQNNNSILRFDGKRVDKIIGTGICMNCSSGWNQHYTLLSKPTGFTVYNGKIYITDTGNDVVRTLDLKSGKIVIFAGDLHAGYSGDGGLAKNARLNKPGGIAVDKNDNVYINDIANNVIRMVDKHGVISTFAGTGEYGYSGDGGKAVNATFAEIYGICINRRKNCLYLADYFNCCIRQINIDTNIITTVVGTGKEGYMGDGGYACNARLNRPVAVCADDTDNLFIAESGNHCVRFYEAQTKKIYTLVGDGVAGIGRSGLVKNFRLANPNGLAIDHDILYILDGANNRLCAIKFGGNKK